MEEVAPRPDLLASHWLVAGLRPTADPVFSDVPLADRLRWVAEAGYAGLGFSLPQLRHDIASHGIAGLRALLADHGLRHIELEVLIGWWSEDDAWRRDLDAFLDFGGQIGAAHLKAAGDFSAVPASLPLMEERFDRLARITHGSGIAIALEIVSFSNIADLPTALRVLGEHKGAGAGLMLDSWHFARRHLPLDGVAALAAGSIIGVEISDVGERMVGSMFEDTLDHRRLPGAGVYAVDAFLAAVRQAGYRGPIGLEVLSAGLRALPVPDALAQCALAARQTIERST